MSAGGQDEERRDVARRERGHSCVLPDRVIRRHQPGMIRRQPRQNEKGPASFRKPGLRSGLIGTPEHIIQRIHEFEAAGIDLLLLQCSPQYEEMERFARTVIAPYRRSSAVGRNDITHAERQQL